jgi:hypothetical protein
MVLVMCEGGREGKGLLGWGLKSVEVRQRRGEDGVQLRRRFHRQEYYIYRVTHKG